MHHFLKFSKEYAIHGLSLLLTAGGILIATPACATLKETQEYIYYDFNAPVNDNDSLYQAAKAASPIQEADGQTFLGFTRQTMSWNYLYKYDRSRCYITEYTVDLQITITLPRMRGGSIKQKNIFTDYLPKLEKHELEHARIARKSATHLNVRLKALGTSPTCQQLEDEINALGNQYLNQIDQENRQYDAQTNHGHTEGVSLR